MFDDGRWGVRRGSGAEVCGGASSGVTRATSKAKESGLCRLTVRHGVSYGTFLTTFEQSRWLCVFGSGRYWVRADETGS